LHSPLHTLKRKPRNRARINNHSLHFYKRLFLGLEPMTSWSQNNSFTTVPGLVFSVIFKIN
jgi:hypothetical protein